MAGVVHADFVGGWQEGLTYFSLDALRMLFPTLCESLALRYDADDCNRMWDSTWPERDRGWSVYDGRLWSGTDEEWLLMHIEVLHQPDADFVRRLHRRYIRLCGENRERVLVLAIINDDDAKGSILSYESHNGDFGAILHFPVANLARWDEAQLAATDNPFALVIQADAAARATSDSPTERITRKIALLHTLFQRDLDFRSTYFMFRSIHNFLPLLSYEEITVWEAVRHYKAVRMSGIFSVIEHWIETGLPLRTP